MIVISQRAFLYLKHELSKYRTLETGGILLGEHKANEWHIHETIFPGPKAHHESAFFQCDVDYVNNQANTLANLFDGELKVLGYWHSHITSAPFSLQDIETNRAFSRLNSFGAISLLIDLQYETATFFWINYEGEHQVIKDVFVDGASLSTSCNNYNSNIGNSLKHFEFSI